jgi:solute carrier family 35 protein E3
MQLLHQYTPQATLLLGMLIPLMEPVGLARAHTTAAAAAGSFGDGTLLGYHYTPAAVAAILLSAVLGLLVSLSTFLVIGATSSLTYNVVVRLVAGCSCCYLLCLVVQPVAETPSATRLQPVRPQDPAATQGHVKTVLILTGGCLMFGDTMPPKKLAGIGIAMVGIIW